MGACSSLMVEWEALKYFGYTMRRLFFDRATNTKMKLTSMLRGIFCNAIWEAWSNPKLTCEDVVADCCGQTNTKALEGKVAIITGASNGLGLETARCMMKYGCHVVWAVRNVEKAEKALAALKERETLTGKATILRIQLDDLTSIKPFAESFLKLGLPLNYLVENAGIMAPPKYATSKQGLESQFAVNVLGHNLLTQLLLPKLKETAKAAGEARLVILGSLAGEACYNIDLETAVPSSEDNYSDLGDYTTTKAMDILHARHLQKTCTPDNVYVCAVHPGIIKSGLGSENPGLQAMFYNTKGMWAFQRDVPTGSATTAYCCLSPKVPEQVKGGSYFFYNCTAQRAIGFAGRAPDDFAAMLEEKMQGFTKPYA